MRIILNSTVETGHLPARLPNAPGDWLIASGNSGTDPMFGGPGSPNGTQYLAQQAMGVSAGYAVAKSTISGSSMMWRMDNPPSAPQIDPATADLTGLATLIMTDNSGLDSRGHPTIAVDWARKAYDVGAEFLFWVPQSRIDTDIGPEAQYHMVIAQFEAWTDQVNRAKPGPIPRCRIIPGGLVYELIRRDNVNGVAPTSTFHADLYADGFHNSAIGGYIVTVIHAAYLYGIDPALMPDGRGAGESFEHAAYIKAKVKQALATYPRAGVDMSGWT